MICDSIGNLRARPRGKKMLHMVRFIKKSDSFKVRRVRCGQSFEALKVKYIVLSSQGKISYINVYVWLYTDRLLYT